MNTDRPNDRPARRQQLIGAIRSLLLQPLPPHGTRIVDMLVLFLGIPVAIVVCIPILAVTIVAGAAVGSLLTELGAPETILALPGLLGFFGGLALCFLALLRIYRRLPASIRAWVASEDEDKDARAPILGRDPIAEAATLDDRLAATDARFAALASDDRPEAKGE